MTVLLVDDQIRILSGLISGLNWQVLGITAIRTATSAVKAKEILLQEQIDILLCDIEMPGENGLSLLRWARQQGMDCVCVFLTSHADFLYAKEAIQLNCFDYILQPARYEEIQATIARAITRVRNNSADKELLHYGLVAKSQEASLFQNLFSGWAAGEALPISTLLNQLHKLGRNLTETTPCFIIWGHLLCWHTEPWPTGQWIYALNNILSEVYENIKCGVVPFSIDRSSMGWLIDVPSEVSVSFEKAFNQLNKAYLAITQHFPCDVAFYVSQIVPLQNINAQAALLLDAKQNNVLRDRGIFCPSHSSENTIHAGKMLDIVQLHRWEKLLTDGAKVVVQQELERYLDTLVKSGQLNQQSLHTFWMQIRQLIFNAAQSMSMDLQELWRDLTQGDQATSFQEIEAVLKNLLDWFPNVDQFHGNEKKLVEQAQKFVEDNLDQTFGVRDVADQLFINADYLSRTFKNQLGISLKEYIIKRKMESAHLLLTTTHLPISVIASKLGYDNFSYFSQVYRKVMGISPSDERKNIGL